MQEACGRGGPAPHCVGPLGWIAAPPGQTNTPRSAIAAVPSIGRAAHVERAARDADATQDLYERYAGQIYGFCVNKLGSRDEAEDALQSTFLNAHRALQRGVTPELELAWLYKIAHNVCLTRRRSTRRRGRVESPSDLAAVQDVMPAPSRESPDDLVRLTEALEHMPETQRRAILLREWQGLSYHEIADELELSQSAVETLIFRARRTLASNLEAAEQGGVVSRARKALDAGALLAALKGLLEGGAAVKVATVAVAATATVVVATAPPTPVSKPAADEKRAVAAVAPAMPTRVVFERERPQVAVALAEAKPLARSAGAPVTEASADRPAPAASAAPAARQKPRLEPKAAPPGQARKQERAAARSTGHAKQKKLKAKIKASHVDKSPSPAQAEQPVAPVAPQAEAAGAVKQSGPKK